MFDPVADVFEDGFVVGVDREVRVAVVDDDEVAVAAEPVREDDGPRRAGDDFRTFGGAEEQALPPGRTRALRAEARDDPAGDRAGEVPLEFREVRPGRGLTLDGTRILLFRFLFGLFLSGRFRGALRREALVDRGDEASEACLVLREFVDRGLLGGEFFLQL